jgi:hypothetical protein
MTDGTPRRPQVDESKIAYRITRKSGLVLISQGDSFL